MGKMIYIFLAIRAGKAARYILQNNGYNWHNISTLKRVSKHKPMEKKRTVMSLGIIHNLQQMKNPLTNIMLSVELIASETAEDKKENYYNTIKHNAQRLEVCIKEMCAFFNDLDSDDAAEHELIAGANWNAPLTDMK